MTTYTCYDVYFDPAELQVDRNGHLMNPDALHIIEFEHDDETEELLSVRRVDENGNAIPEPWPFFSDDGSYTILRDCHAGYGDCESIQDALNEFEDWLTENTAWAQTRHQTYWHPAEYTCVGIIGYVDDGNPY